MPGVKAPHRQHCNRTDWWRPFFRFCIYPIYFLRRLDDLVGLMCQTWVKKYGSLGPQIYDGHNADVKKVIPSDQLLVHDVRDGWEPLCKFLEVPVPNEPYPNLNDAKYMRGIYRGMMVFGLSRWALYASCAAGLSFLIYDPEVAKGIVERIFGLAANVGTRLGLKQTPRYHCLAIDPLERLLKSATINFNSWSLKRRAGFWR